MRYRKNVQGIVNPKGPMYPTRIYIGLKVPISLYIYIYMYIYIYIDRDYIKAKVHTIWVHGPLG